LSIYGNNLCVGVTVYRCVDVIKPYSVHAVHFTGICNECRHTVNARYRIAKQCRRHLPAYVWVKSTQRNAERYTRHARQSSQITKWHDWIQRHPGFSQSVKSLNGERVRHVSRQVAMGVTGDTRRRTAGASRLTTAVDILHSQAGCVVTLHDQTKRFQPLTVTEY